jgi:hypothetical protein
MDVPAGFVYVTERVETRVHSYAGDLGQTVITWNVYVDSGDGQDATAVGSFDSTHHSYVQAYECADRLVTDILNAFYVNN